MKVVAFALAGLALVACTAPTAPAAPATTGQAVSMKSAPPIPANMPPVQCQGCGPLEPIDLPLPE
jgi:hypothetical protein